MTTNFKKALRTTVATLGLGMLLLGSTPSWAADMCFLDQTYGNILVGNNFSFPAAGTCKAFNGYSLSDSGCAVTGTACGTAAEIRFTLPYSCNGPTGFGIFGTSSFHIDRLNADLDRAGAGYFYQQFPSGASGYFSYENKRIPCPSPHAPQ